jgi:GTPase SAR1 family protein
MKNAKSDKKTAETQDLKIAVLGKSLVGKSALTYRFINDRFPTDHDTTIEDQYRINLNIEGVECMLGKNHVIKKSLILLDRMIISRCWILGSISLMDLS